MNIIYNINNAILSNYEKNKNRNYKLLLNLKEMDKYIDNEISNIRYEYDYGYNLNSLLYLYTEMTDKNEEIEIIYKPLKEEGKKENKKKKEKIRIFGKFFVNINYQKCKIIYNNEEYELTEYINDIDEDFNNEIKIKLKGINNISNMSSMFYECNSLSSLPDISKWNTSNVTTMGDMFNDCKKTLNIPSKFKNN